MSPQELKDAGIVTFQDYHIEGKVVTAITQTWEQWEKQDVHKIIGGDYKADDFSASCKQLGEWCEKHKVHYYSALKEDFSEWDALKEAHKADCKFFMMENLS